jgi:hypothetical protein
MRLSKIESGSDGWQGTAWLLGRDSTLTDSATRVANQFVKHFSQTTNALTIVISKEEAQQIEQEAEKSRVMVREMFAAYRPAALEGGNGEQKQGATVSEGVRQMYAVYRPTTPMP